MQDHEYTMLLLGCLSQLLQLPSSYCPSSFPDLLSRATAHPATTVTACSLLLKAADSDTALSYSPSCCPELHPQLLPPAAPARPPTLHWLWLTPCRC